MPFLLALPHVSLRGLERLGRLGGLAFCKFQYFFLVLSLKLLTFVKSYI